MAKKDAKDVDVEEPEAPLVMRSSGARIGTPADHPGEDSQAPHPDFVIRRDPTNDVAPPPEAP